MFKAQGLKGFVTGHPVFALPQTRQYPWLSFFQRTGDYVGMPTTETSSVCSPLPDACNCGLTESGSGDVLNDPESVETKEMPGTVALLGTATVRASGVQVAQQATAVQDSKVMVTRRRG